MSSAKQAYRYDPKDLGLSKPYSKDMFRQGNNLGTGISALAGAAYEGERRTEGSNYQQDFAAIQEYNEMMAQLR